ncbi:MAG: hypothetical protein LC104_19870 [Bacteroidales bacterium]|nr:hypothetical protein [Bacteroidales bacterium]
MPQAPQAPNPHRGKLLGIATNDNSPNPREVEPPNRGEVVSVPMVGGLHHRYRRAHAA